MDFGPDFGAQLVQLLLDLAEDGQGVRPVEAGARHAPAELVGPQQGGQGGRHIVQNARIFKALSGFPVSFLRLVVLPGGRLGFDRGDPFRAENVGMAAFHLVGDGPGDVGEVERAGLFRHPGVEHGLEQQVAQFVLQVGHVVAADRVGDLVGFLDGVGRDAGEILLQIPRAAAVRIAQRRHDGEQAPDLRQGFGRFGRIGGRFGGGDFGSRRGVRRHRFTPCAPHL